MYSSVDASAEASNQVIVSEMAASRASLLYTEESSATSRES